MVLYLRKYRSRASRSIDVSCLLTSPLELWYTGSHWCVWLHAEVVFSHVNIFLLGINANNSSNKRLYWYAILFHFLILMGCSQCMLEVLILLLL